MNGLKDRLRQVSSKENVLVKELRHSFTQAALTEDGYCAIEGVRLLEEALRSGLRVKAVFFSQSARERANRLLPQISTHADTLLLPDAVFRSAVATETPQGVAALVKLKTFAFADLLGNNPLLLGAAGVQDPGNLGTIIRSAEAMGASGVLTMEGTVHAINPKVIRASAGSLFRLPVVKMDSAEAVRNLRDQGARILATSSHKGIPLDEADLTEACCIFVGSEGAGISKELIAEADEVIAIPHSERVESLNAGVAASIILYEAARQRRTAARIQDE
ncbi:MAG: RNA methyltransferase [Candidatus Korobacteraceae bacterium]|jgi:TrmH family RNA methyltransferase